ncbi:MAG: glutamyl-tRNA reductase [Thermodesulfobacteriota bacterium]
MNIVIVGLNHKTASIEIREKISFPEDSIGGPLKALVGPYGLNEAAIISTCNRVEVIGVARDIEKGVWEIKRFLSEHHSIPLEELDEALYAHSGEDAVRHMFRVAASLDSMVMGEPQILGQVKDAYSLAVHSDAAGTVINKLFHKAFSVAKRIRTETKIGSSAVSISFAAVELAKKIFGDLTGRGAMLVGAGEMAELAAKHLLNSGVRELMIANRTYERAVNMAREFNATAIMFREFPHYLKDVDIVIASTAAPKFIIRPDDVRDVLEERRQRPMFFMDISVPRNIDPLVNNVDNAYVYDIDDLQGVVAANMKERAREAEQAETIITEEIGSFYRWVKSLDVVPTIIALRRSFEEIRKSELDKALPRLEGASEKDREALDAMTRAIVNKILHNPVTHLKREANKVEGDRYIEVARKLFDLGDEEAEDEIKKTGSGEK